MKIPAIGINFCAKNGQRKGIGLRMMLQGHSARCMSFLKSNRGLAAVFARVSLPVLFLPVPEKNGGAT